MHDHALPRLPAHGDQQDFGKDDARYGKAERQVLQGAALQRLEINIEHHDDKQEQHRHGADVDDDQQHRQKFGAEQDEQAGSVEKGQDQPQHRVHRVPRRDHHQAAGEQQAGEQIEGKRRHQRHSLSAAMLLAMARSHFSPFASSLFLS